MSKYFVKCYDNNGNYSVTYYCDTLDQAIKDRTNWAEMNNNDAYHMPSIWFNNWKTRKFERVLGY